MVDYSITITDNQGGTWAPQIHAPPGQSFPKRIPEANGSPTLEFAVLPLSGSDSWFDAKFERCDVSITVDTGSGFVNAPYDTLEGPTDDSSQGVVVLRASGGDELNKRVDHTFDLSTTHAAAKTIVDTYTSYDSSNITAPSTTRTDNVTILDRSTTGNLTTSDFEKIPEDSPAHINGSGHLTAHQTNHVATTTGNLEDRGDEFTFNFTTGYSIPKDRVGVGLLTDVDSDHIGVKLAVNGTDVGKIKPGQPFGSSPTWFTSVGSDDRLPPGSHELTVSVLETEGGGGNPHTPVSPDAVAVFDSKWQSDYNFDDADTTPQLYPQQVPVPLAEPFVTRSVRGLSVASTTWTDGQPGAWLFSNGNTTTYSSGTDADFASHGAAADVIVLITAYGSNGQNVNELQGFTLQADLEDMPLVVADEFQGTVAEVLTELANDLRGDFVWAFDTDSSGTEIVRFVRSGSQTTTNNEIEHYNITKLTGDLLDEVKVLGGDVATSEQIRVSHGTAVNLTKDNLTGDDSETVRGEGRDQPYERGTHYSIDYSAGTITADGNPPGDADPIPDGTLVTVDYQFQPNATVTVSSPASPKRTKVTPELPLRSDRACRLAGKQILDVLSSPQYDATAQIRGDTTYSVVTDLVAGRLPASNLSTVDVEATPTGASVRLEERRSATGVISEFQNRLQNVAQYTR